MSKTLLKLLNKAAFCLNINQNLRLILCFLKKVVAELMATVLCKKTHIYINFTIPIVIVIYFLVSKEVK